MRVTVQEGDRSNEMFISTRCRSLDDFILMFGRYVNGNAIFVATLGARPEGLEAVFRIQLADGASVLRGRGVIRKVWTTGDNPFRLPGMLLEVRALTPRSKQVFDRMRRPQVLQLQVTGVEVVRPRHTVTIPPKQPRTETLPRIPPPPSAASVAELHTPVGRRDPVCTETGNPVACDGTIASTVDSALITRRYLTGPSPRAAEVAVEQARGAPANAANPLATVSDDELSGFIESSAITPLEQLEPSGEDCAVRGAFGTLEMSAGR